MKMSVICRVWQHTVPQVKFAEISTEVIEADDNQSDPEGMIFHKIEKLSVVTTDSVEIVVIALKSLKRKNLTNLIRKLLRNYRLTNSCVIKLNEKDQWEDSKRDILLNSQTPVGSMNSLASRSCFEMTVSA